MIDAIIAEPLGGAHRSPQDAVAAVGEAIAGALGELAAMDGDGLRRARREKFLRMGAQVTG